jgi:predicted DNA-binding protein
MLPFAKAMGRTKAFDLHEMIEQGLDYLKEVFMAGEALQWPGRLRLRQRRSSSCAN